MEETQQLPPGFRFHPTDEELIMYYLTNKVSDCDFATRAVADVDLNKCEPWDLPGKASMGEKEWYFFSLRDRKYPTGLRTNRATEAGYWKTTGKDKEIFQGSLLVGMKKTLVFYRGRAPKGEKTNWVMHEYRLHLPSFKPTKEEWVVCRVFQKSTTVKRPPQSVSSPPSESTNALVNELGDMEIPSFNSNTIPLSPPTTNININALQNYTNTMNWNLNTDAVNSITWPLLTSNLSSIYSLLRATNPNPFGNAVGDQYHDFATSHFNMASTSSLPQPPPPAEQPPYNVDSDIW